MSIASEITRLQNDSTDIAAAIAAKGVTVPSGSGYDDYATLIGQISGGATPNFDAWVKNGDTHLWIEIVDSGQLYQVLRLRLKGTIDWGDGTTPDTANVTTYTSFTHTYASPGKYRIDLHPTSGTFYIGGASSSYCVMGSTTAKYRHRLTSLYQLEIGSSIITTISSYACSTCYGLIRVYIPDNITTINGNAFNSCFSLKSVEFEDVTALTSGSLSNTFAYCYALRGLEYKSTGTEITSTYRACRCLLEITIPATVTSIAANSFNSVISIQKLKCLPVNPPTVANANAFTDFNTECVIEVPRDSLTAYQTADKWSALASQMVGV